MSDPIDELLSELERDDKEELLYHGIVKSLENKIQTYSESIVEDYRNIILLQHKTFDKQCAYGYTPRGIILEIKHIESDRPLFIHVDLQTSLTSPLPSIEYYSDFEFVADFASEFDKSDRADARLTNFNSRMYMPNEPLPETITTGKKSSRGGVASKQNFVMVTINPRTGQPYEIGKLETDSSGEFRFDHFHPCAKWKYPRTMFTPYSSDIFLQTRNALERSLENVQRNWNLCEIALIKKNKSREELIQIFKSSLYNFQKQIVGSARYSIKENIVKMIRIFMRSPTFYEQQYLNFALLGGPGSGKTTLALAIAKVLAALGILVRSHMSIHSRATLVGGHLGETAIKTRNVLEENFEGVLFVDEAYAIAQATKQGDDFDAYGVECVNEFVGFMDKNRGKIAIIVAGYQEEMANFWFGANKGLTRRTPYIWTLSNYSAQDLFDISSSFYGRQLSKTPFVFPEPLTESLLDIVKPQDRDDLLKLFIQGSQEFENGTAQLSNQAGDIEDLVRIITGEYIDKDALVGKEFFTRAFREKFKDPARITEPSTIDISYKVNQINQRSRTRASAGAGTGAGAGAGSSSRRRTFAFGKKSKRILKKILRMSHFNRNGLHLGI